MSGVINVCVINVVQSNILMQNSWLRSVFSWIDNILWMQRLELWEWSVIPLQYKDHLIKQKRIVIPEYFIFWLLISFVHWKLHPAYIILHIFWSLQIAPVQIWVYNYIANYTLQITYYRFFVKTANCTLWRSQIWVYNYIANFTCIQNVHPIWRLRFQPLLKIPQAWAK